MDKYYVFMLRISIVKNSYENLLIYFIVTLILPNNFTIFDSKNYVNGLNF